MTDERLSIYERMTKADALVIWQAWFDAGCPQRRDEYGRPLPPPLDPRISPDENWKRLA